MSADAFIALLPLLILAGTAVVGLLAIAAFRRRRYAASFAVAVTGLAFAFASVIATWSSASQMEEQVARLFSFEPFVLFSLALIDGAALFVALSSWSYLKGREEEHGEYYVFLLLASLGAGVLAASRAFATLFLGLELLSVALFPLIAYRREHLPAAEAGIKYLILSGASSAFLFFGMALVYAATGTMDFRALAGAVQQARLGTGAAGAFAAVLAPAGFSIMVVGIGFKLAVVPFHFWTPDVYDGASAPAASFIATVSKGAMLVLLARLYVPPILAQSPAFPWVFGVIAGATMFVGNLLALRERNVKRILACSSIAHMGYLMFAFVAGGPDAVRAISFYLLAYFAMTLGAFAVISELSVGRERDLDGLDDYRGLVAGRPWLAAVLAVMLVSLTGLPLTAGFIGKFVILAAGEGALLWALAVILAANTTISLFYYFRVVSAMFRGAEAAAGAGPPPSAADPDRGAAALPSAADPARGATAPSATGPPRAPASAAPASTRPRASVAAILGLVILTILVIALGVYPAPVLELIERFSVGG